MKRVVITGAGTVNALGHSVPETLAAMREGRCGIGELEFRDVERLSIRIGGQVLEEGRTALLIVDDGPGIPVEARSQAFEPFYTTHSKGTGLGLYIARELAEANRAAIDILENQPGAQLRLTGRSAP